MGFSPCCWHRPGVLMRKNRTGIEGAKESGGGRSWGSRFSAPPSGFVTMKCAVGFAKDKSGTFAYKFQRIDAMRKLSAGPTRATSSRLPPKMTSRVLLLWGLEEKCRKETASGEGCGE